MNDLSLVKHPPPVVVTTRRVFSTDRLEYAATLGYRPVDTKPLDSYELADIMGAPRSRNAPVETDMWLCTAELGKALKKHRKKVYKAANQTFDEILARHGKRLMGPRGA